MPINNVSGTVPKMQGKKSRYQNKTNFQIFALKRLLSLTSFQCYFHRDSWKHPKKGIKEDAEWIKGLQYFLAVNKASVYRKEDSSKLALKRHYTDRPM